MALGTLDRRTQVNGTERCLTPHKTPTLFQTKPFLCWVRWRPTPLPTPQPSARTGRSSYLFLPCPRLPETLRGSGAEVCPRSSVRLQRLQADAEVKTRSLRTDGATRGHETAAERLWRETGSLPLSAPGSAPGSAPTERAHSHWVRRMCTRETGPEETIPKKVHTRTTAGVQPLLQDLLRPSRAD